MYNAINESNYTDPAELEIVTLEDAIYLRWKNDLSFLIAHELNLFEHQSTMSPNLPLRGFLYFAAQYEPIAKEAGYKLYSKKRIELPLPRYIVFYNGTEEQPDCQEIRLSDVFVKKETQGCLECVATVLNINAGHNKKLQNTCKALHDYAILIAKIRENYTDWKTLEEAVDKAVDYCIRNDILAEFLSKNRGEVKDMILTSYNEEEHMEYIRQEAREDAEEIIRQKDKELQEKDKKLQEICERNAKLLAEIEALKKGKL